MCVSAATQYMLGLVMEAQSDKQVTEMGKRKTYLMDITQRSKLLNFLRRPVPFADPATVFADEEEKTFWHGDKKIVSTTHGWDFNVQEVANKILGVALSLSPIRAFASYGPMHSDVPWIL